MRSGRGLYRIAPEDLAALGAEAAARYAPAPTRAEATTGPVTEEVVWNALRQCFDPEIPVNIVDLGLVYDLRLEDPDSGAARVSVAMTLTAPGCGMGPSIARDAQARIEALAGVAAAEVRIVWDPQWTAHMISPEGRKILGLDA